MSEHMDVRVRAGPRSLRSAGYRRGFIAAASVRHNGLWLLSAETESDSRDSVKAIDLALESALLVATQKPTTDSSLALGVSIPRQSRGL